MNTLPKSLTRREEVVRVLADALVDLLLEDRRRPFSERIADQRREPEVVRP